MIDKLDKESIQYLSVLKKSGVHVILSGDDVPMAVVSRYHILHLHEDITIDEREAIRDYLSSKSSTITPTEPKLHWYLFSIRGDRPTIPVEGVTRSVYRGLVDNRVTLKDMNHILSDSGLQSACILSISYLGHMTESEFKGE